MKIDIFHGTSNKFIFKLQRNYVLIFLSLFYECNDASFIDGKFIKSCP